MKAKITAKLETSDHDGYCSGNECEYESFIVEKKVNIPQEYKNHEVGKIININEYEWENFLDPPVLNDYGSHYCELSCKCEECGVERHDYKFTIITVEIIYDDVYNLEQIEKLDMRKIYED
jgi:hypothetical protein